MGRKTKKVGMTRGLGTRYGATLRKRYLKVVTEVRRTHKCPQCGTEAVSRVSVGIWNCKKCDITFAGGAYTPVTKLGVMAKRQVKSLSSSEA
jgi:large subunit ribosomal protein L37Ae